MYISFTVHYRWKAGFPLQRGPLDLIISLLPTLTARLVPAPLTCLTALVPCLGAPLIANKQLPYQASLVSCRLEESDVFMGEDDT